MIITKTKISNQESKVKEMLVMSYYAYNTYLSKALKGKVKDAKAVKADMKKRHEVLLDMLSDELLNEGIKEQINERIQQLSFLINIL